MSLILAADLGTTALKVALHDLQGNVISKATEEYELITPDPATVEVDVETYWHAFKAAVGKVMSNAQINPAQVSALGLSVQSETLIVVDDAGKPLRRAIVWLDNRAQSEADELAALFGHRHAYEITGQVKLVPTWPAAKILWLRKQEPALFEKVSKFLLLEDYFLHRLTGEYVCECSLVSSTCYWNINTKQWWPEMLDVLEVREEQLPHILEPGMPVGTLLPTVAEELGMHPTTVVSTGCLDGISGSIGAGNVRPGIFSESTGGALSICSTVSHPVLDPDNQMPCHYHGVPDLYNLHTFTSAGIVLRWFRDQFASPEMAVARATGGDAYDLLGAEAAQAPPGCEGLVMLPHLQGAMAPEANPKAKGVFFGFTLRHRRNHFIRAIMEAVGFMVRRNMDVIVDLGVPVDEIRAFGGGARSPVWKQIEADITQRPVVTTVNEEAATLGAAILAGKAVGLYSSIEEAAEQMVQIKARFEPTPGNRSVYEDAYNTYMQLYDQCCVLFG